MDGFARQRRYTRARRNEAAEIDDEEARTVFLNAYAADTTERRLIRRGLAQVLADDPVTAAFFDRMFGH